MNWAKDVAGDNISGKSEEQLAEELKVRLSNDPVKAATFIAEKIDFWYGKGTDWWLQHLDVAQIINVFHFIIGEVFKVKKK